MAVDPLLHALVDQANELGFDIHLAVTVGGIVVTGVLMQPEAYRTYLASIIIDAGAMDLRKALQDQNFIHLANAAIPGVDAEQSWFRCRLEDVTAFSVYTPKPKKIADHPQVDGRVAGTNLDIWKKPRR